MPSIDDPALALERRRMEAKERVAAMTDDEKAARIAELLPTKVSGVKLLPADIVR
jgi:hypothetical protein